MSPKWLSWQKRLNPLLNILGYAYAGLMQIRAAAYRHQWLHVWKPPVPCISVGNICWGGSGKTPLCQWLLHWSLAEGMHPVLLTRGYRARPHYQPFLVQEDSPCSQAGDEPLLLAKSCPQAKVVIDAKRSRGGHWSCLHFNPDIFILDDAMQHLAVDRDVNLILLRQEDIRENWNKVQPAGSWREGKTALKRADAFLLNLAPKDFYRLKPLIRQRLRHYQKPIFSFWSKGAGFIRVQDGLKHNSLPGEGYLLISGVGNPEKISRTAEEMLKQTPKQHLIYSDHYRYSAADWRMIKEKAISLNCAAILCTPKDGLKLKAFADESLWSFDLHLECGPYLQSKTNFSQWLRQQVAGLQTDGKNRCSQSETRMK